MTDTETPPPPDEHSTRARDAFDSFREKVGDRLDSGARESVERLRDAAASRDAEKMREQMGEVREQHGWLALGLLASLRGPLHDRGVRPLGGH